MPKIISLVFCALLLILFVTIPAKAQPKKKGGVEPYVSKTFRPLSFCPLMQKIPDQILGKIETGKIQYTLYIAELGQGTVNAHPATLVKLDSHAWILACMGSMPQVVLK